ncbi:MAG: DUF5703 domain-containing protein [Bacteroidota bacterium]|nr:DUF5703 domain-containing protein [Bacteroidota bacterium]
MKKYKFRLILHTSIYFLAFVLMQKNCTAQNGKLARIIQQNNIVWKTVGGSSHASMPLGNGDIGLNVWTEANGNICFYISKTDSWGENGRLLKIGKVVVNVSPNPFEDEKTFIQTLDIYNGKISIRAGSGAKAVQINVWVDANHPVINLDADVPNTTHLTAYTQIWRNKVDTMKKLEISDLNYFPEEYGPTIIQPDVLMKEPGAIVWYHHNPDVSGFRLNLKMQGLEDFPLQNPLKDRIFGAMMEGDGFKKIDDSTLASNSGRKRHLQIAVLTQHPSTSIEWVASIENLIGKKQMVNTNNFYQKHENWWHQFWNRSWLTISNNDSVETPLGKENTGMVITRGYTLQRFINGCAGRGKYPIKFNGSIFTVDYPGTEGFADYRRWGTGYWWQNTRLPYWTMAAAGDFEMMRPLFKTYFAQLSLEKYRTQVSFHHEGAYYPECTYFWGSTFTETWGEKPLDETTDRLQASGWHKREWVSGLELSSLMFEYYEYTQQERFATDTLLPLTEQILLFFDQHYHLDETGHLKFEPSQALETWWNCTNALPEIAGVHYLIKKIKELPSELVPQRLKSLVIKMEKIIPNIPTREFENKKMLAPAEKFEHKSNVENPELYAVFPFRLYGLGKPEMKLAVNAWDYRDPKGYEGWRQDDLWAALLGKADDAKNGIINRASHWSKENRFPAFWGPNYDWVPDQDHGSVLLKTTQSMLLQCDDKEIRLLPAWPKNWDVSFKLNAPYNTTVECVYKNGKVTKLIVTPEARRKDVVMSE